MGVRRSVPRKGSVVSAHQPPLDLDVPGRYLLLVNTHYAPYTFTVYDYPYVVLVNSLDDGQQYIQNTNQEEPGFFPKDSYRWLYGHWSKERIDRLAEILHEASASIL